MKKDNSYHDFVVYDLFAKFEDITSKHMMGGWSIYRQGIVFAAIIGNELYLKAKGEHAEYFQSLGWQKFTYNKKDGKVISMSYWLVPEELIDDQLGFDEVVRKLLD